MKYLYLLAGFILPALFTAGSPVALASEHAHQHREHSAHEHGTATLNVAIENNSLYIELESPAMNIVGFEHQANNEKQNRALSQAVKSLKDATQQFGLPIAAQCSVSKLQVESPLLNNKQHQEKHAEEHSEFHASYTFNCKNISALDTINVRLFKTFKGMNEIDVQIISNSGQATSELTVHQPLLVIKQ